MGDNFAKRTSDKGLVSKHTVNLSKLADFQAGKQMPFGRVPNTNEANRDENPL